MLNYLKTLDRRIIYLFVLVGVILPIVGGFLFPVQSSPMTDSVVKALKELEPGSVILVSADFDPGSQAELQPMLLALLKYCFENEINVVSMGLWPMGPTLIDNAMDSDKVRISKDRAEQLMLEGRKVYIIPKGEAGTEQYLEERDGKIVVVKETEREEVGDLFDDAIYYVKGIRSLFPEGHIKYGENYLAAGYQVGAGVVILDLVASVPGALKTDALNSKPVESYPIMNGIDTLKDIDMVFTLSSGSGGIKEWVIYGNGRSGVKVCGGVTAVSAPEFLPYLVSRQLAGMLAGLAGAAEFEAATGYEMGEGIRGMTPQSFAHIIIILFIIIGNLVFLVEKYTENK
jgi:hypothetical protein